MTTASTTIQAPTLIPTSPLSGQETQTATKKKIRKKDESLEAIRAIGIFLIVFLHVIGTDSTQGLKVADGSGLRWLYTLIDCCGLPLFALLSGYIYGIKPLGKNPLFKVTADKCRRLMLPFISVATIQYLAQCFIPGTNGSYQIADIWQIYVFSYAQFWYLQAITLVFIVILLIEYLTPLVSVKSWAICFGLSVVASIFPPTGTVVFSTYGLFYILPFFLLGLGLFRFPELSKAAWLYPTSILVTLCAIGCQQLGYFGILAQDGTRYTWMGILLGISIAYTAFLVRRENRFLSFLSYYGFGIYLFHVFGQAGARILFKFAGIEYVGFHLLTNMIGGLGFPIIMQYIIEKNVLASRIFLGHR